MDSEKDIEASRIKRVQAGDLSAFEELMDEHMDYIRAFVSLQAPLPHLVEDVTHETFVTAWRKVESFKSGSIRAWFTAIARNVMRGKRRDFARESRYKEAYLEHTILQIASKSSLANVDALDHLVGCIQKLPENHSELIRLRYELEMDSSEIAEAMGKSRAWVRTTLHRIRAALKTCIATQMEAAAQR